MILQKCFLKVFVPIYIPSWVHLLYILTYSSYVILFQYNYSVALICVFLMATHSSTLACKIP